MFNTPPPHRVKTRSVTRAEQKAELEESALTKPSTPPPTTADRTFVAGSSRMDLRAPSLRDDGAPHPLPPHCKTLSVSTSASARRKRLELEAAKEKAKIQLELIDKQLEADLADLESYSPHNESRTPSVSHVEKWLDERQLEPQDEQPVHDTVNHTDSLRPPAVVAASTSDNTVQMLASALKDFAEITKNNGPNNSKLLSRLSTNKNLPDFSGDPMDWIYFKHAYDESTDVCGFGPKENLWRLRKCLRGPAKDAVSALLASATSPDVIMSTLALRFGNADVIVHKVMQNMLKLQPVSIDYHKDIVAFSVSVQNFIAAVRAVGREEYLQGMHISTIILSKLPPLLISKWSDYSFAPINEGKMSRLDILSQFLHEEALKVSTTANILTLPTTSTRNNSTYRPHSLLVQSAAKDDNKCLFCKGSQHDLPTCKKFKRSLRKDRWRHVKRHGLCFKCLVNRHDRETRPAPVCDKEGCGGAHHRLLHYEDDGNARQQVDVEANALVMPEPLSVMEHAPVVEPTPVTAPTPPSPSAQISRATEAATCFLADDKKVLLKVVPVNIHGPNGVLTANAILDDGSTVSIISAALAARAGLRGRSETMRVCGAWNDDVLVCESTVLTLNISGFNGNMHNLTVRSVEQLNLPVQNIALVDCDRYAHLKALKNQIHSVANIKPELLIGQDNYNLLLPLEICVGQYNEPSATRTPLGWCVHGAVQVARTSRAARSARLPHATLNLCEVPDVDAVANLHALRELHEEVRRSYAIDALGVSGKPRQNADDIRAQALLEKTAVLADGRWTVGLPWKDPHCSLPDSFPSAFKRLQGVEKKMRANKEYAQRYEERVNHLFENYFAREMTDTSLTPNTWYLPHFGVDNPNKKKLRLVYDAAAKSQGMSLNDYLLTGPDLLASLFGIMVRFRENRIAVTGDIKDMFLRIKINAEDQNALRFLWRGSNPAGPVKTYAMTSLIFGANCSPFIAQYIKNLNASRYMSTLPDAVSAIHHQHYMDDYIDSLPDETTAITMVKNIRDIHSAGGFEIRNWTCNSATVLDTIPKDILGTTAVKFGLGEQNEGERTLGLIWYPAKDELGFDVSFKRIPETVIKGEQRPTKRIMLRVIMSIFDVFGFLSPFTTQGKIMLQDTWRQNIDWDDVIPNELYNKWCSWLELLKIVGEIRLPRWYQSCAASVKEEFNTSAVSLSSTTAQSYDDLELHLFSDASLKAMCAAAYWRWKSNGQILVAFVASKSRVASVKPQTVPRLELQAALLAARLADSIAKAHRVHVTRRYFWCDSSTVLHWIYNNTRQYKTFEANRLGEIDDLTKASEWRYVPTGLNVADIATRETFNYNSFLNEWFKGPEFLYTEECHWPVNVIEPETKETFEACVTVVQDLPVNLPVPDPNRFSSWLRFVRSAASVLKFVNKCKGAVLDEHTLMEQAKHLVLRQSQADSFASDIQAIKLGKCLPRDSRLLNLSPYLDEHDVLRVSGRIDAVENVLFETKRPVILDGRHPTTRLLVRHYHVKAAHGHQEAVVNDLKQLYWVIQLRPTVKNVVSRCMLCRLRKATPLVPRMGDLPQARMAHHQRTFTYCGIDLFGPMEVTVCRHREKRYGVLFTCLTVRAIHIEIVHSLTTDSFIMALRRMASRRGWPLHIFSDNGTNLRGAHVELRRSVQEIDEEALRTEAANNNVQWTFSPPASPHWGGAWERLIKSVKTSLRVILKERAPSDETLSTLLAEVEGIVNGRPLTHVSVEPGSTEALTPNHFLLGSSSKLPVSGVFDDSDLALRKQWRKAQRLADLFWQRWLKEFLPQLLPRKRWQQEQRPLCVGDLVLVVDPDSPRNVWPRGLIKSVVPGKDGRIRVVEVTTATGVLRRSVARVAPIIRLADVWKTCNKIRAAAFRVGLNLWDWYRPLDPEGNSLISESKFVSVLAGPLRSVVGLSDSEIAQLADYFRAQDGRVLYHQLCQLIHGEDANARDKISADCLLEACPPPPEPECHRLDQWQMRRLCCLLATIAERELPLKPYFQDYELVAKNDGRITFAHFARVLSYIGIQVSAEDFRLLVRRFIKDSYTLDYVEFLRAVEAVKKEGIRGLGVDYQNPAALIDSSAPLPKLARPEIDAGRSTAPLGATEVFHPVLKQPRPTRQLIELMLRVQEFVLQRKIRVSEFFRDYDPLNSGRIAPQEFRRAMDAMGLGSVLSPQEAVCVLRHYLDPNDKDRVCWRTFEDDCDQVFAIKELEKHPELHAGAAAAAVKALPALGSASERGGLGERELDAAQTALLRVRNAVVERSIDLRPAFGEHDEHNNGHVSRGQLRRVLARLGVLPTPEQVRDLELRYLDDCGFNYVKLLDELVDRPVESAVISGPPPAPRGPKSKKANPLETDIVQILAKIKGKMVREGVRPLDFLQQFDKNNELIIPRADFYRGLASAGLSLSPLEMDTLMEVFCAPARRRYVEYRRFADTVGECLTQGGLERAPLLEPVPHVPTIDTPLNHLNFEERNIVSMALAKLAKFPDQLSNILEVFKDMDKERCGTVPRVSADRALCARGLLSLVSARERELVYKAFGYQRGCGEEVNYRALCSALDLLFATASAQPC